MNTEYFAVNTHGAYTYTRLSADRLPELFFKHGNEIFEEIHTYEIYTRDAGVKHVRSTATLIPYYPHFDCIVSTDTSGGLPTEDFLEEGFRALMRNN